MCEWRLQWHSCLTPPGECEVRDLSTPDRCSPWQCVDGCSGPSLRSLEVGIKRDIQATVGIAIHDLAGEMFARVASPELRDYFEKLRNAFDPVRGPSRIPSTDIVTAYRSIGLKAQRAVRSAYVARTPQRDLPPYRMWSARPANKRYANGALLRAISAPDFFEATTAGLRFINEERLNREARHWRRLNFGTGGGATIQPPREFRLDWGKLVEQASPVKVGLAPDVRPAFRLPRGVFVEPGIFYPMSELGGGRGAVVARIGGSGRTGADKRVNSRTYNSTTGTATRGIASTNFLDRGMRAIAHNLLPTFSELFERHYGERLPAQFRQRIRPRVPVIPKGHVRRRYTAAGYNRPAGSTYGF